MVGNIILYFSTLASAFRFKAPLPPYLPPAEKARQQLVSGIIFIFSSIQCDRVWSRYQRYETWTL